LNDRPRLPPVDEPLLPLELDTAADEAALDHTLETHDATALYTACEVAKVVVAAAEPNIKRFVYTSSAIAATYPTPHEKVNVDSSSWNHAAVDAAWKPPPYDESMIRPGSHVGRLRGK
jgi:hypothetical protein